MQDRELIGQTLGLSQPWSVDSVQLDMQRKRLDIELDFPRGTRFACPVCSQGEYQVYDTRKRTWRHLDFFQYKAYLHARLPRVTRLYIQGGQVESASFNLLVETYLKYYI